MSYPAGSDNRSQPSSYPDYMQSPPPMYGFQNADPILPPPPPGGRLTPEQLKWLIPRLKIDDKLKIQEIIQGCIWNRTIFYALPFLGLSIGGLVAAKRLFPMYSNVLSRPRFYVPYAFLTAMIGPYFLLRSCRSVVGPEVAKLYSKYEYETRNGPPQPTVTYDELRRRYRQGMSSPQVYNDYSTSENQVQFGQESQKELGDKTNLYGFYNEPTYISGTPMPTSDSDKRSDL